MLNFSLITLHFKKNKDIIEISNNYDNVIKRFYDTTGKRKLLNPTSHLYREITVSNKVKIKDNYFQLLAIFSSDACPVCVREVLDVLNDFHKDFPRYVQSIYLGSSKDDLYKILAKQEFETILAKDKTEIFSSKFEISFPSICLVDKNNLVHSIYKAEPNNLSKQKLFFKKVKYILSKLNKS